VFEAAELGNRTSKEEFEEAVPALRAELLNLQFELSRADFPVLVVATGDDRAGCEELFDLIHEWMDARLIDAHAFHAPSDEEQERPLFWRYWRRLPPRGRMGVFHGSWAASAIVERIRGDLSRKDFERRVDQILQLEQTLADDGTLILKFMLHIPREELEKRARKAGRSERRWWTDDADLQMLDTWDEAAPVIQEYVRRTSTAWAPWIVVESTDARWRSLTVMRAVAEALRARLDREAAPRQATAPVHTTGTGAGRLAAVDLNVSLDRDEYKKRLRKAQERFHDLVRHASGRNVTPVLVFEGWDAAGKGGAIRRLTRSIPSVLTRVEQVAAPSEEERAHHYLWRFWNRLPRAGRVVIFDRSWYGRVLVERVEGFATPAEWARAYSEINAFEEQLVEHGWPVLKFWLHLDPDVQLARFQEREATPFKKYKITDEDYRNRDKWDAYLGAVDEMIARTSTELAPWTIVEANDKRWARVKVAETVCEHLEAFGKGGKRGKKR
jgi:polyphosphate:AMP phosphotransferase